MDGNRLQLSPVRLIGNQIGRYAPDTETFAAPTHLDQGNGTPWRFKVSKGLHRRFVGDSRNDQQRGAPRKVSALLPEEMC